MKDQPTSTSSQASEDLLLPQSGQDSGLSPSVKSTNTANEYLKRTFWPTPKALETTSRHHDVGGGWHHSPTSAVRESSQTSSTLTEPDTKAATSSQADFLASHSALPGSDEARRMTVISGRRCCALLKKQDPLGCLARTFLESSRWNSTTCFLNWKPSATPAGRLLFRLVPSMPDTDETDCGLWLTPSATNRGERSEEAMEKRVAYRESIGRKTVPPGGLAEQVMWPTATATDWKRFPMTTYYANKPITHGSPDTLAQAAVRSTTQQSGSLNPTWVEWLMGYPPEWTALEDSATQSSRKSCTKYSKKSES